MTGTWFLMDSGSGEPAFNMAFDEALLRTAPQTRRPVLRFYSWTQPAASFGYFQRIDDLERRTPLRPLIRRPTGGGLVPHDADWTYSVTIPPADDWYRLSARESYRHMHEWIRAAFKAMNVPTELAQESRREALGQCFAGHERDDLLWQGRKVAGAAQRRTRTGLLIQGSVQPPPLGLDRAAWQRALCGAVPVTWTTLSPAAPAFDLARLLEPGKYATEQYNRKR